MDIPLRGLFDSIRRLENAIKNPRLDAYPKSGELPPLSHDAEITTLGALDKWAKGQ